MKAVIKNILAGSGLMVLATMAPVAGAQTDTLESLLQKVEQGSYAEAKENTQREAQFRQDKAKQVELLNQAKAERARLEALSQQKEQQFEENEKRVVEAEARLKERLGTLGELFGHLTSAAGDLRANFEVSLVSAQYPGREEFLESLVTKMSSSDQLPSIAEIERLWFELQREMTEQGKVATFPATVVEVNGDQLQENVVRVGSFNAVTESGKYLKYANGTLQVLARQPDGVYLGWAEDLAGADSGLHAFGADPTGPLGGSYLSALIASPTLEERWHQGGYVGYAITALGLFGLLIAIWRLVVLTGVGSKVNAQLKSDKANSNNPLGRVLLVHEENPKMDHETLELKLNEAVLREIPNLEKAQGGLKIIAAVAPLMGLLGTVTGMIQTFQAITIFGAGDPQAMAGGISQALVTTVEGLVVAIPIVLLHTVVSSRSSRIVQIIEEQAAGIIAQHAEK